MIKRFKRWGAGLGIYFDKEEVREYHINEGDIINIDDIMLFNTKTKKSKKLTYGRK